VQAGVPDLQPARAIAAGTVVMDNLPDISIHLQSLVELAQAQGETLPDPKKGSASSEQVLPLLSRILYDMEAISEDIEAKPPQTTARRSRLPPTRRTFM